MPLYLLDTNISSDVIRNPEGSCAERMKSEPADRLCTSIVLAAELRFRAAKKGAPQLSLRVNRLLDSLAILPLEPGADLYYATLRCDLERRGLPIGANDMLIAAHALALKAILVSDNIAEFARVANLNAQNWLRPA
jgi:tRNA(fMet)-specific endonuclease VapC